MFTRIKILLPFKTVFSSLFTFYHEYIAFEWKSLSFTVAKVNRTALNTQSLGPKCSHRLMLNQLLILRPWVSFHALHFIGKNGDLEVFAAFICGVRCFVSGVRCTFGQCHCGCRLVLMTFLLRDSARRTRTQVKFFYSLVNRNLPNSYHLKFVNFCKNICINLIYSRLMRKHLKFCRLRQFFHCY